MADDANQPRKVVPAGLPCPPKQLVPTFYLKFKAVPCRYSLGSCRWGPQCIYAHGESEIRAVGYGPTPEEAAIRHIKLPKELIDWWLDVRQSHAHLFSSATGDVTAAAAATHEGSSRSSAQPSTARQTIQRGQDAVKPSIAAMAAAEPHIRIAAQVEKASSDLGYLLEVYTCVRPADRALPKLDHVRAEANDVNACMRDMADQLLALSLQYEEMEQAVGRDPLAVAHLPKLVQERQRMEAVYMQLAPQVKQMNSLLKKVLRVAPAPEPVLVQPQQLHVATQSQALPPPAALPVQQAQQQDSHEASQTSQPSMPRPAQQAQAHQCIEQGNDCVRQDCDAPSAALAGLSLNASAHACAAYEQPQQPQQLSLVQHQPVTEAVPTAKSGTHMEQTDNCSAQVRTDRLPNITESRNSAGQRQRLTAEKQQKHTGQAFKQQHMIDAQHAATQGERTCEERVGQPAQEHDKDRAPVEKHILEEEAGENEQRQQQQQEATATAERTSRQAAASARRAAEGAAARKSAAEAAALKHAGQIWMKDFKAKHTLWNKLYMPLLCKPGSDEAFNRCQLAIASKPNYEAAKAAVAYLNLRMETASCDLPPPELRQHLDLPPSWLMDSTPEWQAAPHKVDEYIRCILWEMAMQQKLDSLKAMLSYMRENEHCLDEIGLLTALNWVHIKRQKQTLFATLVKNSKQKVLDMLLQQIDLPYLMGHEVKRLTRVQHCTSIYSGTIAWAHGLGANMDTLLVLLKWFEAEGLLTNSFKEQVAFVHHLLSAGYPPALVTQYIQTAGIMVRASPRFAWDLNKLQRRAVRLKLQESSESSDGADDSDGSDDDDDDDKDWLGSNGSHDDSGDSDEDVDEDEDSDDSADYDDDYDDEDEESVLTTDSDADSASSEEDDEHQHATTNRIGNYLHAVLQSATPSSALQLVKDAMMLCKKETSSLLDMSMQVAHGLLFVNQSQDGRSPLTQALMRRPLLPQLEEIINMLIKHGAMPLPPGPDTCPAGHKLYMDYPLMSAISMVGKGELDVKTGVRIVKIMAASCKDAINTVQPRDVGGLNALAWAALQQHASVEMVGALMSSSAADPLHPIACSPLRKFGWVSPLGLALMTQKQMGGKLICKAMLANWCAPMLLDALRPGHGAKYLDAFVAWVADDKEARDIMLRPLARLNKTWHDAFMEALLLPGKLHLRDVIMDHATEFRFDGQCVLEAMQRTGLTLKQVEQMLSRGAHVTVLQSSDAPATRHQPAGKSSQLPIASNKCSNGNGSSDKCSAARHAGGGSGSRPPVTQLVASTSADKQASAEGKATSTTLAPQHLSISTLMTAHTGGMKHGSSKQGMAGSALPSKTMLKPVGSMPASLASEAVTQALAGIACQKPLAVALKAEAKIRAQKRQPQAWRRGRGLFYGRHVFGDTKSSTQSERDQEDDASAASSSSEDSSDGDSWPSSRRGNNKRGKGAGKKDQKRFKWREAADWQVSNKWQGLPPLQVLLQTLLQRCSAHPVPEAYRLEAWFNTLLWLDAAAVTTPAVSKANDDASCNGHKATESTNARATACGQSGPVSSAGQLTVVVKVGAGAGCVVARNARQLLLALLEAKDQRGKGPLRSVHLPHMRLQACHLFGAGEGVQPGVAQLLEILLKSGSVDANERDPTCFGMTLLHLAAADHAEEACSVLLKAGADPMAVIPAPASGPTAPTPWSTDASEASRPPVAGPMGPILTAALGPQKPARSTRGRAGVKPSVTSRAALFIPADTAREQSAITKATEAGSDVVTQPLQAESHALSVNMHGQLVGSTALHMCIRAQIAMVEEQLAEARLTDVLLTPSKYVQCQCCSHRITTAHAKYGLKQAPQPCKVVLDEDAVPGLAVMQLLIRRCPELVHAHSTPTDDGVTGVTPGRLYTVDTARLKAAYESICKPVETQASADV